MRVSIPLALALTTALAFSAACSKKGQRRGEESPSQSQPQAQGAAEGETQTAAAESLTPTAAPTVQALPTPEPTPQRNSYIVRPGDSLWSIAGRKDVQGDHFRWPLLFKANRDQIIDPDLIEPQQDLTWKSNYTSDEVQDARSKATDTPRFKPHRKPRKMLPLNY